MKKVKATKELCKELTEKLGCDFYISDEGSSLRLYHKSAKRGHLCFATYLSDPVGMAHAISAVLAALKVGGMKPTKETINDCFNCYSMAVSHYVYGSPSTPATQVLASDKKWHTNCGRGYFDDYKITRKMKVVILNRCRKSFASISYGVGTDCEGCSYNSCRFRDYVNVA